MTTKRGNPDQYLQKVGGTYHARVRVPRTLEKYVGQTHIRRTLETGDRSDANLRKYAVVGKIKAELEQLKLAPTEAMGRGISFADAKVAGVNYLDLPATTILAGWKRGMISM